MNSFLVSLAAILIISIALSHVFQNGYWYGARDDSDSKDERSGLIIFTDHKTGVQYVSTIMGGITVRVDANGKPVVKAN